MKEGKQRSNIKQYVDNGKRPIKGPPSMTGDSDELRAKVNRLEAALHHLYTNCPVTPTLSLKRNPNMLGHNDSKCWMLTDNVFNVFAKYGFDEDYFNELDKRLGVDDES